jgi:osmotically-inducible protein OsmY
MNELKVIVASVLAIVVLSSAVGCAGLEKCGVEGCPSDQKITSKVQARLNQDTSLGAPDSITVQTINGIVYLNGQVDVGLEKRTAEAEAKQVPGVVQVVNNIDVQH